MTTGSVDGCWILPERQFVGTNQRVDPTHALSVGVPFSYGSCDNRLSGWLLDPAGETVCRDEPARGSHTCLICWGFHSPMGAAGEWPEFEVNPPLGAPGMIFLRGHLLNFFPQGDTPARSGGLK